MTEDEKKEYAELVTELHELNVKMMGHSKDFMQAGGSMEKARVDTAYWVDVLDPIFERHHEVATRLRELSGK